MEHTQQTQQSELALLRQENLQLKARLRTADLRARERNFCHLDRLERTVRACSLAIFDWPDVQCEEIFFTAPVYELLGFEPYSFIPNWNNLLQLVHRADRASFSRKLHEAIYLEQSMCGEFRLRCASGTVKWMELSACALRDYRTGSLRLTGSLRDISGRVAEQNLLRETTEILSLVIKGTNAAIWDWPDVSKQEVVYSSELLRLIGYENPRFKLNSEIFCGLIHEQDWPQVKQAVQNSTVNGERFDVVYRLKFRGKGYRWVRSMGAPDFDETGKVYRLTGAILEWPTASLHPQPS